MRTRNVSSIHLLLQCTLARVSPDLKASSITPSMMNSAEKSIFRGFQNVGLRA